MYNYAIVRKPAKNFSNGITTANMGKPDFKKALKQHEEYCKALTECGVDLIVLDADDQFPDGCFVEDTAVVTEQMAVITRPGAESRRGETKKIEEVLFEYKKIERIKAPGTLDGGDIVRAEDHFFIGISGRTNEKGGRQMDKILNAYGYTGTPVLVSDGLHLKSGMNYIGDNTVIALKDYAGLPDLKDYTIIPIDDDESYAAISLRCNDYVIVPKGFPKAKERIQSEGFKILEVETTEFQKMDGGLTCLSLLF